MSLTAFNRARRLKQINEMKPENIKPYVDTNKTEIKQASQEDTKEYVEKVVEAPEKEAIDNENADVLARTPKKRRKYTD